MRVLVIVAALVAGGHWASADPDAIQTPAETAPSAGSDTLSPDEIRDVLSEQAPKPTDPDAADHPTGTVRFGTYHDSDQTTVYRALGTIVKPWGHWQLTGSFGVDAVTSASVDVRSSPALSKVDVVTSASGRSSTSGGTMTDTRYQLIGGAGWNDTAGRAANVTAAAAKESDYASVSGGINGSYDVLDRTATLLGGFTFTDNWISSVLDSTLHRTMFAVGWSGGIARVLTRDDAVRLRYDGKLSDGYQASPYRNVRFGNWIANLGSQQITFMDTIGSADGLPEHDPDTRISHAAVLEWVHSLALGIGLHPELRVAHDSWGVDSLGAAIDLRIARPTWRLLAGYRFYFQTRADFFADQYTQAPAMYTYYTSDKELGDQRGHLVRFDFSYVLYDADDPSDGHLVLNLQADGAHYDYPGFTLLPSRDSIFGAIGLSWEK